MTIFNSLAEVRINQFKNRRLQTEHNYVVKFGANYTAGNFVKMIRQGRTADDDSEPDGIYIPNDSLALIEVSGVNVKGDGTILLTYYGQYEVSNDGGSVTFNGSASFVGNEAKEESAVGDGLTLATATHNNEQLIYPRITSSSVGAFASVTLRVLAYIHYGADTDFNFIDA